MFGSKTKNPDYKFNLGDKLKDQITSFVGIVTCRTQWLHGCNTYRLQPTVLKDGAPMSCQQFDEPQLVVVEEKVHKPERNTGGPHDMISPTNG